MLLSLKSKILSAFLKNPTRTGGELEKQLGVTRTAIWKAINQLCDEGFLIKSKNRSGYVFWGDGDVLNKEVIQSKLVTRMLGKSMEVLPCIDSTNLYIKKKLPTLPKGHVVLADEQTNGMGRKGRPFVSPKGGLYMSMLLKPQVEPQDLQFLTICTAVSVINALEEVCGFKADIKWVNDIYYGGKKLCGISTDATFSAEIMGADNVVIGIGINIGDIAKEIAGIATSIQSITGKMGFKNKLAASVLNHLENILTLFLKDNAKTQILQAYRDCLFIIGKKITVFEANGKPYEAVAVDLTVNGELIVETNGTQKTLSAAEVSLKIGE